MTDERNFCVVCGARLPDDCKYCPECGYSIDGDSGTGADQGRMNRMPAKKSAIPIFILIYGIVGLLIGIENLIGSIGITEASYQSMIDQINQMFEDVQLESTWNLPPWTDSTKMLMVASSVFGVISPILALVSYYFCYRNGPWKNALILCGLASIVILGVGVFSFYLSMGVMSCVIGLVVTYVLYRDKDKFAM